LPSSIVFSGNDLYVANIADASTTGNIDIFRNYLALAATNATPSVTLKVGAPANINQPFDLAVSKNVNTMAVANNGNNDVILYRNISTLAANAAPAVILNNANSLVNDPRGLAIREMRTPQSVDLFVANFANSTGSTASVTIYRDVATLATNDVPDQTLNADTSFMATGCAPNYVGIISNNLYVSTDGPTCGVFIFNGADSLATSAIPDVVLTNLSGFFFSAQNVDIVNNVLWVADAGDPTSCSNNPGVFWFFPGRWTDQQPSS